MTFWIDQTWENRCIRDFLQKHLCLSARMISRLKQKENGITKNGVCVTVRAVLRDGDRLELALEDGEADRHGLLCPTPLPLEILYEDEAIVAVNKPPLMPTHPSHGHFTDTLANALCAYYQPMPFVFRAVNRLDADTSGVVLVAKDAVSAYRLGTQMQQRQIQKEYLAILQGVLPKEQGSITTAIRRRAGSVILREAVAQGSADADEAQTDYTVCWATDTLCGVHVLPKTGRTHQLRVHFASLGTPILYDPFYGTEVVGCSLCLHAEKLHFRHPITDVPMTLTAPMTIPMQEIWNRGLQWKNSCQLLIK